MKELNWDERWGEFRGPVPERYNIARECCGRWAVERSRFALYYEDAAGATSAWSFWDVQRAANQLSNVLAALGTMRGDRVAIMLPQRPETAIAHIACYQMGATVLPLSSLFSPEALEYRLAHAGARIAIVDVDTLEKLASIRDRLPGLKHVIGVGGARASWVREWDQLLPLASTRYTAADTAATDPALIVYTSDSSGNPEQVPMAQHTLAPSLPYFVAAHDGYPRPGDMFWSPADWASIEGLFCALLPVWNFGQPILAYRGEFDAEKAFWLMEKYGVKNTLLAPSALNALMTTQPRPRERYHVDLRSLACDAMEAAVGEWVRTELGVGNAPTSG